MTPDSPSPVAAVDKDRGKARGEFGDLFRPAPCDHHRASGSVDSMGRVVLDCPCGYHGHVTRRFASEVEPPRRTPNKPVCEYRGHMPLCTECQKTHVSHKGSLRCRDCSHERRRQRDAKRHKRNKRNALNWSAP